MEYKKLNLKVRTIWIIRNLILIIVLAIALLSFILMVKDSNDYLISMIICSIIAGVIVILLVIWPFLSYKNYTFAYDDKRIIINYGVIFKHHIVIPIRQIQDLHLYATPMMLLFKLDGIIISTAGSNFSISGIKKEDGEKMVNDFEKILNERLDTNND